LEGLVEIFLEDYKKRKETKKKKEERTGLMKLTVQLSHQNE